MIEFIRDTWADSKVLTILLFVPVALIIGVVLLVIFVAIPGHERWVADCESRGGHVISRTSTGSGVSSDGKVVVTTDTTYYCLTDDGRILEVK